MRSNWHNPELLDFSDEFRKCFFIKEIVIILKYCRKISSLFERCALKSGALKINQLGGYALKN